MKVLVKSFKESSMDSNDQHRIRMLLRDWLNQGNEYFDEDGMSRYLDINGYDKKFQQQHRDDIQEIVQGLI